ncbi:hypothetical protein Taro_015842 [Colocasia esculenta]|uniref:DUF7086 domain-containing protein n=1 Tax=Colocasia esculenta TaxID=4460 RepID=A0A843UND7_COLES|nr:hypothetical protein [Colocasia esculenta]
MNDDNNDARKRKNGGCEFDLNLRLSPPPQRPRHEQERPAPLEFTALSLSTPAPSESSIKLMHSGTPRVEAALLHGPYPFLPPPRAMVGSAHSSALSTPTAAAPASQPLHPIYRPRPLPPTSPIAAHLSGGTSGALPSASPPPRDSVVIGPSRAFRARRNTTQGPRGGKEENIEPPFPWATSRRAVVHSRIELLSKGIRTITGEVQCKRCEHKGTMDYDLEEKYMEVARYIAAKKHLMHDRAPPEWTSPVFPPCPECKQQNSLKPVVAPKKRAINWLFMLLGQTLGCCTLEQLKYFCKHTKNHRTGAKDRVLYLTFLGICKQLESLDLYDYDR